MLAPDLNGPISIIGINFSIIGAAVDEQTREIIFELGTGNLAAPRVIVQIPYSFRADTAVGYWMNNTVFLPEPVLVTAPTSIFVRAACDSIGSFNFNGVKMFYQGDKPLIELATSSLPENYKSVQVGNGMSTGERIR